jgi:hypothetical protein
MKNAVFILFIAFFASSVSAQLPNVKLNLGKTTNKTQSTNTRDAQKNAMQQKNNQTQQSGYKPKTDEERACDAAEMDLTSARQESQSNLKTLEYDYNKYLESDGKLNLSVKEDFSSIRFFNKVIQTLEKNNCPKIKIEDVKKELEEQQKKLNAFNDKIKTTLADAEKKQNKGRDAKDALKIIGENMLYCCQYDLSPWTIKDLTYRSKQVIKSLNQLDLKTNIAEYKAILQKDENSKDQLEILTKLEASNDETWAKYNDAIFKAVADAHAAKKNNSLVYLISQTMVELSEEILKFNPNHGAFKPRYESYRRFLTESKANITKLSASAVHEKNLGNIVFSNSEIKPKQENTASFKNSFKGNEFVYGMIYHPFTKMDDIKTNISVYDEKGARIDIVINFSDESTDGHYGFYFLVDPYKHGKEFVFTPQFFSPAKGLEKLPYKNNKLRFVLETDGLVYSEGTINFDITDGPGIITEMYEKDKKLKYTLLTPPPVKAKDPAFEAQITAYYNSIKPAGTKINRVISDATQWTVHTKDVYVGGKVVTVNDYRSRTYTVIYTTKDGTCEYTFGRVTQKFVNNAYEASVWEYRNLDKGFGYDFPCQNINR